MNPNGLTALQSHLDAVYNADPETCSSPWFHADFPPDLNPVVPEAGDDTGQPLTIEAEESLIITPSSEIDKLTSGGSTYQMSNMSIPKYNHLKIIGEISVDPVTDRLPEDAFIYLLLGPTGAGKSCFIQALAGDSQDLGISKDQLAGFTQKASAYKLVNVLFQEEEGDRQIYLVDTPGFSDPKISSLGVFVCHGDVEGYTNTLSIRIF
ncbi:hypothetical protein BJ165DRAFT_1567260 [Panaeolus papilionaceus]|nr:hypothetical protein BJ165DRAFT_1567260 [Panaeolus papilionaceus]